MVDLLGLLCWDVICLFMMFMDFDFVVGLVVFDCVVRLLGFSWCVLLFGVLVIGCLLGLLFMIEFCFLLFGYRLFRFGVCCLFGF